VLDLPPTESEWMIQPLLRCNTLILVILPSVADCNKLISMIELLTCFDARYKLPRSAIFAVVNMITPEDNFTVDAMQTVIREQLDGYCPPIIATIPFNPKVRTRQNLGILPVSSLDDFTRGIDQIVDYFYRETLGLHPSRVAKKGLLEGLKRIKIKW
jgi:MinD-like ATPase involved in chromosome partitioning or flagellar assembly